MNFSSFFLFIFIHFFCIHLVFGKNKSSLSPWALSNIETDRALGLLEDHGLASSTAAANPITVAIVDTGIDPTHPDLANNLWTNPNEIPDNGIDDDGNGFVDDIHGWNFAQNNNLLTDHHGHGTHIAGIIAGQNTAGQNVAGPKLMILKYYDAQASAQTNLENMIKAFRYALKMKAQVINFSGGGPGFNAEEAQVLKEAEEKNVLVVAAAGNDGANSDLQKYYPADYGFSNIISVTAIDCKNQTPPYANYGIHTVDIAAPGDKILSTLPNGRTGEMSGTSQATAFVTSVAALLIMQNRALSPQELIQKIKSTGNFAANLIGKNKSGARLNAYRALAMRDSLSSSHGFRIENLEKMNQDLFTIRPSR